MLLFLDVELCQDSDETITTLVYYRPRIPTKASPVRRTTHKGSSSEDPHV